MVKMGSKLSAEKNVRLKWENDDGRAPRVGDLVWVIDESVKRYRIQMTRVLDVFPSSDGVVRSANIQSSIGILVPPRWRH